MNKKKNETNSHGSRAVRDNDNIIILLPLLIEDSDTCSTWRRDYSNHAAGRRPSAVFGRPSRADDDNK